MAPDAELMVLGIDCDTARFHRLGGQRLRHRQRRAHHHPVLQLAWRTDTPDYEALRRQTDAELAAGVIHANAAGNDGDDPTT